jgi:hypothetical protein
VGSEILRFMPAVIAHCSFKLLSSDQSLHPPLLIQLSSISHCHLVHITFIQLKYTASIISCSTRLYQPTLSCRVSSNQAAAFFCHRLLCRLHNIVLRQHIKFLDCSGGILLQCRIKSLPEPGWQCRLLIPVTCREICGPRIHWQRLT